MDEPRSAELKTELVQVLVTKATMAALRAEARRRGLPFRVLIRSILLTWLDANHESTR